MAHDLKRPLNKGQGLSCWYQSISHIRLPVNNKFCDSIRLIPFLIGVSLELSVYLHPFFETLGSTKRIGGHDPDLSGPLDVIGHIDHSIRRGSFPIGGLLIPNLYL